MTAEELSGIFEKFRNLNVLIAGDVMLDSYWWGDVHRISPEAPVPVVSVKKTESRPGGAANVALNVKAMGARPFLCSVIGDDSPGVELRKLVDEMGMSSFGLIEAGQRKTTVKTRIIGNNHQLIRVDHETEAAITPQQEKILVERAAEILKKESIDVVIFQDYDKGVLTPYVISEITKLSNEAGIPVAVDPKRKNFLSYNHCTLFKPNLKELSEGLKMDIDRHSESSISSAAEEIRKKLDARQILLTLSENGVMINEEKGSRFFPAHVRDIADVSGAGDTVISIAALCLAVGTSSENMALLSNLAGGLVCEYVGVVPVKMEDLRKEALNLISTH